MVGDVTSNHLHGVALEGYTTPLGSPRTCDISYLFTFQIYLIYLSGTDAEMYADIGEAYVRRKQ